jgi:hypothetical protein
LIGINKKVSGADWEYSDYKFCLHVIYFDEKKGAVCLKTSSTSRDDALVEFKAVGGHPMDIYGFRLAHACPVCNRDYQR